MNKVNVNKNNNINLVKNFIKDLSYENPQNFKENKVFNDKNTNLNVNMNVFYNPYNNKFFSLLLRYTFDCSSKENKKKLFNLELDYYGFFKISKTDYDQEELTKIGIKLLFPFIKEIVEDITRKGGGIPISLNDVDFDLIKN